MGTSSRRRVKFRRHGHTPNMACPQLKKWKDVWNDRLEILAGTVDYWIKNKPDKLIEVIELYY